MNQMWDKKQLREVTTYFKRIAKELPLEVNKAGHAVGKFGKAYAKAIAPEKTGSLKDAITYTSKGNTTIISSGVPNNPDGRSRAYNKIMHNLKTAKYAPKSGEPEFMWKTFDLIAKEFPKKAVSAVTKVLTTR